MPLLGDPGHSDMVEFLRADPGLYFDYGGFPPEAYEFDYAAPGASELGEHVRSVLSDAEFSPEVESQRGFDHGVFVPLMLMYPDGNIPIVQVSLVRGLDPQLHIDIGRALSGIEADNLLIIGSGMSFHNLQAMMNADERVQAMGEQFHDWLHETCAAPGLSAEERDDRLVNWETAPYGRFCHPREEHLIPLHVCHGAAAGHPQAEIVYHSAIMKTKVSGLLWQ